MTLFNGCCAEKECRSDREGKSRWGYWSCQKEVMQPRPGESSWTGMPGAQRGRQEVSGNERRVDGEFAGRRPGEAVRSGASQTPSWRSRGKAGVGGWGSGEHTAPEMGTWLSVSPGMWCSAGKNVVATALAHRDFEDSGRGLRPSAWKERMNGKVDARLVSKP